MAVSRPFLLALLGIVLLGATVVAAQGARTDPSATAPQPVAGQADPAAPAPEPAMSADQAVAAALSGATDSARFALDLDFKARGQTGSVRVTGATDDSAKQPEAELNLDVAVPGTDVSGGFVTTGGKAWFTQDGSAFRVPDNVVTKLTGEDDPAAPAGSAALSAGALPFDPSTWLADLKSEGSETVDGVETQHVTGRLNAAAMVKDLLSLAPAGGAPAALPPNLAAEVDKSVQRADFGLWVGEKDKVLRRLTADVALDLPGAGRVEGALDLRLSDVGRPQDIQAPERVTSKLPGGEFGSLIATVLESGAAAGGGDPALVRAGLRGVDNPRRLQRALRQHRKVVLLLSNPRGLDDELVGRALERVERDTNALVLRDVVTNTDRYGSLVEDLRVAQTPALVVIDREGSARVVEGFIDPALLAQVVADAR